MVQRGAFKKKDFSFWEGDYYYLPMAGVKGKKEWLGFALMHLLDKEVVKYKRLSVQGLECFINDVLSVVIGFRNGRVRYAADLSKFHNQVILTTPDTHVQRLLWRDCDTNCEPESYVFKVNNLGVRSAHCITTCALHIQQMSLLKYTLTKAEQ